MKTPVEGIRSAQIMDNFQWRPITVNEQLIDPVDDELFFAESCLVSFARPRK
jgi:hypothetical protein